MAQATTPNRRFNNPADALAYRSQWNGECLEFTGHLDRHGYGKMHVRGRGMLAHRLAWELEHGEIPDGAVIDHRCHNTSCVRVAHLRLATHKLNMEHQTRAHHGNKSGVRGVYWQAQRRKWAGQVRHNGKSHYVGLFEDVADAETAVIAKRLELFTYNDSDRTGVDHDRPHRLGADSPAL
ncbi:HNH endonuclease signature motif containing protein [Nesterenkonia jeotgali]|uniref:HNH nuclease domain-containing protein n=1 Tax=Nesterenkonia jeotgali TaxID=317018 RepID=A0A0W8IG93_9MICC|nr:HNH endonuclease signature motif containing protein [Nesterenkonia jeotgali]KUG58970.1 hypothetical protein AVL63_02815 [Nesterenkonia jeotgali]